MRITNLIRDTCRQALNNGLQIHEITVSEERYNDVLTELVESCHADLERAPITGVVISYRRGGEHTAAVGVPVFDVRVKVKI